MTKLLFFTNSFPYGIGEEWKYTELLTFQERFDRVLVAPLTSAGDAFGRKLPESIELLPPLFQHTGLRGSWSSATRVAVKKLAYMRLLLGEVQHLGSLAHVKSLATDLMKIDRILSSEIFLENVQPEVEGSHLYFFWGKGYADVLPFVRDGARSAVVRVHGFDLYHHRNRGYIPFQRAIMNCADAIATVSRHGQDYLRTRYPSLESKLIYAPLGSSRALSVSAPSSDGIFRIVTCSLTVPVKRLHLLPGALRELRGRISWTHIGGGEGLDALKEQTRNLPDNVEVHFLGSIDPGDVLKLYSTMCFDLFVNVSSSEGIPVSIMEAMSGGIPVIATDVGGTSEIVDDDVGWLLPEDLDAIVLAHAIATYISLAEDRKAVYRKNCRHRHQKFLGSRDLARIFVERIVSLTSPPGDSEVH